MSNVSKWIKKYDLKIYAALAGLFIIFIWGIYPNILATLDTKPAVTAQTIATSPTQMIGEPSVTAVQEAQQPQQVTAKSDYETTGERYGTFGDSYGSFNALFSALAFTAVFFSLLMQGRALKATRKDIDKQYHEMQKQSFINEFHALMEEKRYQIKNLSIPDENKENNIVASSVIFEYAKRFKQIRKGFDFSNNDESYFKDEWNTFVKSRYDTYEYSIFSYFRIYALLFKKVAEKEFLSIEEKESYFDIIKASISIDEKNVWMWVGTFRKSVNRICNKYNILSGLYHKDSEQIGIRFFNLEAFGNSPEWERAFSDFE